MLLLLQVEEAPGCRLAQANLSEFLNYLNITPEPVPDAFARSFA